jgi:hypothetical protein
MQPSAVSWISEALDRLAKRASYQSGGPIATEPSALAALALIGAGRNNDSQPHLRWLAQSQIAAGGSVPPYSGLARPGWPTPLAILAAAAAHTAGSDPVLSIDQAKNWLLSTEGKTLKQTPEFGHDGMLVGWPWALETHSWQEPTAWSVLALKSLDLADHPRTREGVRLLIDRLLPNGGCNYGNTYVLGQRLRAHVEPSGLTLVALAGETADDPRIPATIGYVASALSDHTTPISLSYGLLGLTAHHRTPASADAWLEAAYTRAIKREPSALTIALLVLAAQGEDCLLIKQMRAARK